MLINTNNFRSGYYTDTEITLIERFEENDSFCSIQQDVEEVRQFLKSH